MHPSLLEIPRSTFPVLIIYGASCAACFWGVSDISHSSEFVPPIWSVSLRSLFTLCEWERGKHLKRKKNPPKVTATLCGLALSRGHPPVWYSILLTQKINDASVCKGTVLQLPDKSQQPDAIFCNLCKQVSVQGTDMFSALIWKATPRRKTFIILSSAGFHLTTYFPFASQLSTGIYWG